MSTQRLIAILLALFLGGIMAHKFYLREIWKGVVGILFCWTLIPALISFIQFLAMLSWSDEEFFNRYPMLRK